MRKLLGRTLALGAAGLLLGACGDDAPLNVSIPFRAMVGSQSFACGQTYSGLGTTGTTWQPKDFRVYLHNVRLVTTSGAEVAVTLTDDGVWQDGDVALLDFEDNTGLCSAGSGATNTRIVGTVPAGEYSGLRFTVGVPFGKNHQAIESARPPLKERTLNWTWQGGYVFLRLDGNTQGLPNGHNVHLGSANCQTSAPNVVTACDHPNRPEVEIAGFDPEKPFNVVLDAAALLATSNLDTNQASTPAGCMSGATDEDCAGIFPKLGLTFGTQQGNATTQAFFRKE
ncbi:metallo-mystery pair system four-Cys motif protein [Myxococcaceae bacterium GXIMD 01537]